MSAEAPGFVGTVVQAGDVTAEHIPASGGRASAVLRTLVDTGSGQPGLVRRLADLPPLAALSGTSGPGGQLLFVIAGTGRLEVSDHPEMPLAPDRAALIPAGAAYRIMTGRDTVLRLDLVSLPEAEGGAGTGAEAGVPASRDFAECDIETTGDRQFRVLFGPGKGCSVATQFVGEIPPGRAPDHSHPYDEVVLVLRGQGVAHIAGAQHPLSAGTCAHLPPGLVHCLENTGTDTLRVLGVFHPADSPAAKLG